MPNFEERCECGAYISSSKYKHLKKWRKAHNDYHEMPEPQPEGSTSDTERALSHDYEDILEYRPAIGFAPNPTVS